MHFKSVITFEVGTGGAYSPLKPGERGIVREF